MNPSRARGFTLIELMIVVAVIGLLAAVAYPSYLDSVLKGKRAQGRTALSELLQQQERYMTQRNCYLPFTTAPNGVPVPGTGCGGVIAASVPMKGISGDNLSNSAYLLSAAACPATGGGPVPSLADCVQVTAVPAFADPKVGALSMTSTGARSCSGTSGPTSKLCWP